MKRLIYILSAIIFILVSCTQEIIPDADRGDNCINLTVSSSGMMTKVIEDLNGNANERVIKRLDCFFYPKGNTNANHVYYEKVTGLNADGLAEVPVFVNEDLLNTLFPSQSTCDVYVIANLPDGIEIPASTDTTTLGSILITANEFAEAVKSDKSLSSPSTFVMKGHGIATRDGDDVTGNISLRRLASKITVNVYLPEHIVAKVHDTNGEEVGSEKWFPYFDDSNNPAAGITHVQAGFHNGTKKDCISGDYELQKDDYFETSKTNRFIYKSENEGRYLYRCEAEFYTYSSEWNQGDAEAPYLTLVIPWKKEGEDIYQTFYYQVLVNAAVRKFEANRWYDLTLNVGVLGSTVEATPVEIEEMSYHVLDWSTLESSDAHLNEEVDIFEWQYLIVHENRIEMNNTTVGELTFDASHSIGWKLEWPGSNEDLDAMDVSNGNGRAAYYINCRSNPPAVTDLADFIDLDCFDNKEKKNTIIFEYPKDEITANVYSPVYVHLKMWLNIDGEDPHGEPAADTNEEKFVEYVTFVYYPAMYIIPDLSVTHSVYVNAQKGSGHNDNSISLTIGNKTYDLGGARGEDASKYMHTITVSSFTADDTFTLSPLNNDPVNYIIGDPRVRVSDTNLNKENNTNNGWRDGFNWLEGSGNKKLTFYYPTSTEGESYRIVSPKFRISSKLGGYSAGDAEGAAMRCASYQENGYPAGRWRIPTTAEVLFIVKLQDDEVIQDLFVGNQYWSATHMVDGDDASVANKDNNDHSVRCVYDEWYWGSNQEAAKSTAARPAEGDEFLFTWGDKQIIW